MKQAILHGPRDLRVEDIKLDTDHLEPDQLWVEVEVSALSTGTDRGNYEGAEQVPGAPGYPRWVGYSNVGVVRTVGSAVQRFAPGDRVFSTTSHASDYIGRDGDLIAKVPDGVSSEDAAMAMLYFMGLHSLRRGHFEAGEVVAIIGLGILGLTSVELTRAWGGRVVALGNDAARLQRAEEVGAHLCLRSDDDALEERLSEYTNGIGVDLVVLAANPWPAYRVGVDILRENGRMAVLSLPGRGEEALDFNPLALEWFYGKALTIIAVNGHAPYRYPMEEERFSLLRSCEQLLAMMEDGSLQPGRLITHRLPPERMTEAYEMAYRREKSMVGVVFEWRKG